MNTPTIARELSKTWNVEQNPIVELEAPHSDARGSIIPLVDETMRSAVLITSKKNTVRANHFHHTDWHYCYVLKGAIDYYYRPTGSNLPPKCTRVSQGQMFFTPSQCDHAMHFVEDTEFLCLGRNPRDQATYEADITRIELFNAP
ncbi:MAG TPA: cupin domain-containing protein [Oligoflexia bacterium]|nr:cupin domain-containing protein [Oligoflexia bacterium]